MQAAGSQAAVPGGSKGKDIWASHRRERYICVSCFLLPAVEGKSLWGSDVLLLSFMWRLGEESERDSPVIRRGVPYQSRNHLSYLYPQVGHPEAYAIDWLLGFPRSHKSWVAHSGTCIADTSFTGSLFSFLPFLICWLSNWCFLGSPPKQMCACMLIMSSSLWLHGLWPASLLYPWDSLGKNTEVGCLSFLQGIFPIQGSNPCLLHLLHCRWILYCWTIGEYMTCA